MTVLSVAQEVARKVGVEIPTSVVGSTDRTLIELLGIMSDAAEMIANGHEWQKLKAIATITGDGVVDNHALPDDFEGMTLDAEIWSSATVGPLTKIENENEWLEQIVQGTTNAVNSWIIYNDRIWFRPALGNGTTAKYFYLSNYLWSASGTPAASIANNTDTFRLDEKLLRLATIWMWKASKGQAYGEQQADYEQRLARKVKRDGGAKILRIGSARLPSGVTLAYPRNI